jgi:phospholipase C
MSALLLVVMLAASLAASLARPAAAAADGATPEDRLETLTPIKHFVTLMQENHSFDNYFGAYPGADGFPPGTCVPVDPGSPGGECVEPFPIGSAAIADLGHSEDVFQDQYDGGRMDGFVSAHGDRPPEVARQAMGYYDDRNIPYYWNLADEYVLFDRFFTSSLGGSVRNHFYWVSGGPGNEDDDALRPEGFAEVTTIFDRLQEAGVSWKFYVQNYRPEINYRSELEDDVDLAQLVWVPLLNIDRFLDDPELSSRIVPLEQFYLDVENDELPAVSYIVPSGASEHPPGSIEAGERFVRSLLTSLMRSSAWSSTAFTWTYDDWGGWYDHVEPPRVDRFGYGFRAPALLVSPYARRGHVDSTTLDFTSHLAFIEHNWGIEPLASRDRNADPFLEAFDFAADPRPAVLLGRERVQPPVDPARSEVVYASYGASVGIALAVAAGAAGSVVVGRGRTDRERLGQ